MKIHRLYIPDYFILKDFEISFQNQLCLVIGENGSGKSSIIEVLAYIFGHLHKYFVLNDKTAEFIDGYQIEYEVSYKDSFHTIFIESKYVPQVSNTFKPTIRVDGEFLSISQIDKLFGGMQNLLPSKVILFYAGITCRLFDLNEHFRIKYRSQLIQKGNIYTLQPLVLPNDNPFCYIQPDYLSIIVLALLLDKQNMPNPVLERIGIDLNSIDIQINCKEPTWHKDRKKTIENDHHPWGIEGTVSQEIFDRLVQNSMSNSIDDESNELHLEYFGSAMFNDVFTDIDATPNSVFSILDVLLCSDIIKSIEISWEKDEKTIYLERLSEGEKQLIMTWGTSLVWNQENLLFLFDEPDVSLHPKWQRLFISDLKQGLKNSCAIVSTHSPIMLSNADNADVIILDNGLITRETPKYYGKDINTVLFELMGVSKRIKSISDKIEQLFSAIENEDIELSEKIYAELNQIIGSDDPDLVQARMQIDYLKDDSF